ncbi:MAG: hypothetical protein TREMPRED_003161 [Tremellales sp. Tagirdzhanova-0007]|nr:MAG: hypothetical protein TREMPRED_003161 [Tremellales sp. Tagirdzhanova-0007]
MSERKVLNKYFPPDFDPSKIKRRKIGRDPQMVIRLMAPFSMRCNRCGEYIYKGKKFNARKETAQNEEYYGIKIFRFYIASREITFKTDPKNADYTCEHGATRNFENWTDADPNGRAGAIPDAAADDEYDSDGNAREDKKEKDAMADLERSQEQSRREMEMMDELADLRQRNARLELSNANADPESLLSALHAERESAAEEARRRMEEEEDDAVVRQYFVKVGGGGGTGDSISKGKGKAVGDDARVNGDSGDKDEENDSGFAIPSLTIKRRPAPGSGNANGNGNGNVNGNGIGNGNVEPSVASLLAARAKVLVDGSGAVTGEMGTMSRVGHGSDGGIGEGKGVIPGQVKRKREGMQKLLGIKKKVKA